METRERERERKLLENSELAIFSAKFPIRKSPAQVIGFAALTFEANDRPQFFLVRSRVPSSFKSCAFPTASRMTGDGERPAGLNKKKPPPPLIVSPGFFWEDLPGWITYLPHFSSKRNKQTKNFLKDMNEVKNI